MNKSTREFANLIEEGAVEVSVKEAPWGKEVGLSDNRGDSISFSKEQYEQLREFLKQYKEIILEIHEKDESYDGIDLAWHIGKIADKYVREEDITNGDFALITDLGHSGDGTYTGQMRNIYNIFPDQNYSSDHFSKSTMCELTQTVDEETVVVVNENAVKYDIDVKIPELRAIRDINNADNRLEKAVQNALERKRFKSMNVSELTDLLYDAHLLLGKHDVSKIDIQELVKSN